VTRGDGEGLFAHRCPNDHLTVPGHHRCPRCGEPQEETVDLSDAVGRVVTWTESRATPPGVRSPNPVAIVAFEVEDTEVRAIGGLTRGDVAVGEEVRPVHVDALRDPDLGIREAASQEWSGYRFEPI